MAGRGKSKTGALPDLEPDDMGAGWTERQKSFARRYLQHGNGARAYREAGFEDRSPEYASQYAHLLLKRPHIKAWIAGKREEVRKRFELTNERIVAELSKVAFSNMSQHMRIGDDGLPYLDLRDATQEDLAALSEFYVEEEQENVGTREEPEFVQVRKVKFKAHDKLKALSDLARISGLLKDKIEVEVVGEPADILEARERARRAREG